MCLKDITVNALKRAAQNAAIHRHLNLPSRDWRALASFTAQTPQACKCSFSFWHRKRQRRFCLPISYRRFVRKPLRARGDAIIRRLTTQSLLLICSSRIIRQYLLAASTHFVFGSNYKVRGPSLLRELRPLHWRVTKCNATTGGDGAPSIRSLWRQHLALAATNERNERKRCERNGRKQVAERKARVLLERRSIYSTL